MPKTTYHISLKGYVGVWNFDRIDADAVFSATIASLGDGQLVCIEAVIAEKNKLAGDCQLWKC